MGEGDDARVRFSPRTRTEPESTLDEFEDVNEPLAPPAPTTAPTWREAQARFERERTPAAEADFQRAMALRSEVKSLVPRGGDMADYYASTDKKHFSDPTAPGSKSTDPSMTRLEDVVELAGRQRGNLDGDDREELIALGASPEAFQ